MIKKPTISITLLALLLLLLSGCGGGAEEGDAAEAEPLEQPASEERAGPRTASAIIDAKSGSTLAGTAIFTEHAGSVMMELTVSGVKPGPHAVHLHVTGDCSSADASSAGGHWNPTSSDHGKWGEGAYHRGDIGNLEVGKDGNGSLTLESSEWTIGGPDETNIVGRAVIVHAGVDDFVSQPTGAAGGRIGCGVIQQD